MKELPQLLLFAILIIGCSDDLKLDKGVRLISPTESELVKMPLQPGDSLVFIFDYEGNSKVLMMNLELALVKSDGSVRKQLNYDHTVFNRQRLIEPDMNEPIIVKWKVPEDELDYRNNVIEEKREILEIYTHTEDSRSQFILEFENFSPKD